MEALISQNSSVKLINVEKPLYSENEVLIRVAYCGVNDELSSSSDSVILDYEFSGTVDAVGEMVKQVAVGDRVVIKPEISCGKCRNCKLGKTVDCSDVRHIGLEIHGGLAEYAVIPEDNCLILPETVSLETATLIFPSLLILDSVKRAFFKKKSRIAVLGSDWLSLLAYYILDRSHEGDVFLIPDPIGMNKLPNFVTQTKQLNKSTVESYFIDGTHFVTGFSYQSFSEIINKDDFSIIFGTTRTGTKINPKIFSEILLGDLSRTDYSRDSEKIQTLWEQLMHFFEWNHLDELNEIIDQVPLSNDIFDDKVSKLSKKRICKIDCGK